MAEGERRELSFTSIEAAQGLLDRITPMLVGQVPADVGHFGAGYIGDIGVPALAIPASRVALSPDGTHLVATGVAGIDTSTTMSTELKDVHIISTGTLEVIGLVDIQSEWIPDIQFSSDSRYLYLGEPGGGRVNIIQLETAEILDTVTGSERTTMFGPAAMLSTPAR